jgi:hypothetical protein
MWRWPSRGSSPTGGSPAGSTAQLGVEERRETPGRFGRNQRRRERHTPVSPMPQGRGAIRYVGGPPTVSRLSAAIPHPASRRTNARRSASWLSRVDVVPSGAAKGVVKGCRWHGMQAGQGPTSLVPTDIEVHHIVTCSRPRDVVRGGSRPPACRVGLGQVAGDRLGSRAGIALQ